MLDSHSLDTTMEPGSNSQGTSIIAADEVTSQGFSARSSCSGAAGSTDVATNDIGELIGELQAMLSEALERQQGNPDSTKLIPVGSTRWREVHSRLMSQAGAPPCPLEPSSLAEVAELQEALQQSSAALRSSQQQLQLLSARVEELQTQLEADCEGMMASMQEELQAAHAVHQRELQRVREAHREQLQAAQDAHRGELQTAQDAHQQQLQAVREAHQEDSRTAQDAHRQQLKAEREAHRAELQAARVTHEGELQAARDVHQGQLRAEREAHQEELRELQERLQLQQDEATEAAAAVAAAREAALQTAVSELLQAVQQAEAVAEAERGRCREAQRRLAEYDNLWWSLQAELKLPEVSQHALATHLRAATQAEPFIEAQSGHPSPEPLIAAARALQARLREQAARGAAAADTASAAAAMATADAAAWRSRAQQAVDEAARAGLAAEELRHSLDVALAALHEESASLAAANASLSAELERRLAQVAALTASGTELEARAARLGAEVTSMAGLQAALQAALQAELLEAGGRHAALEGVIAELRVEVGVAMRQRDELAAQVSELREELQQTRGREKAQRLGLDMAQQQRDEGARLAAEAADAAAKLLAETRRASDEQMEQLRLQVMDLYERLGQARARSVAEAARLEETRQVERAQERIARAALRDEAAAAAAAALCERIFRAVAATGAAAELAAAQSHAMQQTARVVCARAALLHGEAAMAARLAEQSAMETATQDLQARLAVAEAAAAEAQALLADSRQERERLSTALSVLQGRLEESESAASGLAAQLAEVQAEGEVVRSRAADAHTAARDLQVELAAAQQALWDHQAVREAAREQLSNAQGDAAALREQLEAAEAERQQLHQALAAAEVASSALQGQLADSRHEWDGLRVLLTELQGQLEDGEAAASGLAAPLDAALAAGEAARSRAACADAAAAELRVELAATQDHLAAALAAAEAAREHGASAHHDVQALRQQLEEGAAERRQLQLSLVEADALREDLQALLNAEATSREALQERLAAAEANQQQLQDALAAAEHSTEELQPRISVADASVFELQAQLGAVSAAHDALQQQLQQLQTESAAEREVLAERPAAAESAMQRASHVFAGAQFHAECEELPAQRQLAAAAPAQAVADAPPQPAAEAAAGQFPTADGALAAAVTLSPGPLSHQVNFDATAEAEEGWEGASWSSSSSPQVARPSPATTQLDADECGEKDRLGRVNAGAGSLQQLEQQQQPAPGMTRLGADAGQEEVGLRLQLSALRGVLQAEREAQAARVVTLRALRSAERTELQRQLAAAAAVATAAMAAAGAGGIAAHLLPPLVQQGQQSAPPAGQYSVTNVVWELPTTAIALEPRGSAPPMTAAASSAARPPRRSLELPNGRSAGVPPSRVGLPPLPPTHDAPQQQPPHASGLERCPSRNSNSSSGSRGSSYWLPAAAAMAAAAADYDAHHEPLWVTNAAFGSGIPLGCVTGSSTASSEAPVADLAETIAALQAELAASKAELRMARGDRRAGAAGVGATAAVTGAGSSAADAESVSSALACGGDVSGSGSVDDSQTSGWRSSRDEGTASVASQPTTPPLFYSAQYGVAASATAGTSSSVPSGEVQHQRQLVAQAEGPVAEAGCTVPDLERALEAAAARQIVFRALRAVERAAFQRELADARAARCAAAAAAGDARSRLAALLSAHCRVCGELEALRAAHDELAAEMGPARRLMERLRSQNEQLRVEAQEAAARHAADVAAAAAAAADAATRVAACEAHKAALAVRCEELAVRCEGLEAQLARAASASATASPRIVEAARTAAEAGRVQLAAQVLELRAEQAAAAASLERLRAEYAAARQDRQRLQQQLASVLAQTASVQAAAEELISSLRAAHDDLDAQKAKTRDCEVEMRSWARQAALLQEQLALLVQGARVGLPLRGSPVASSPCGAAIGGASGAAGTPGRFTAVAAAISGAAQAGASRSPSLDAGSGVRAAPLPMGLLHGAARTAGGSFGMAGVGRRCLSAIDLTSLTRDLEEEAQQQQAAQQAAHPDSGFPTLRGGDGGPFLPGLPVLNVHHLALLQGRGGGGWNLYPWGPGAAGGRMRELAGLRLRACATAGGAPLAPATTPTRDADRAAQGAVAVVAAANAAAGGDTVAQSTIEAPPAPVTSPIAAATAPPSQRPRLQQGLQHQDGTRSSPFGLTVAGPTSPKPPSASASPTVSLRAHWQAQAAGGLSSPQSARPRSVFAGQLRRLAEEEGEGQEAEGDRGRQVEVDSAVGKDAATEREGQGCVEGSEGDAEDGQDDGASVGVEEGDITDGFPRPAGRTASEADMHLFYNPVFTTGESRPGGGVSATARTSLPAVPRSAREEGSSVWSPSGAASLARSSVGHLAVQASVPQPQEPHPEAAAPTRRFSADPSAGQQPRRLPVWPPQPAAAATAEGDEDGHDDQQLLRTSRSNPVVKLYRKISKRLSSSNASRESRDGGAGEAARG